MLINGVFLAPFDDFLALAFFAGAKPRLDSMRLRRLPTFLMTFVTADADLPLFFASYRTSDF